VACELGILDVSGTRRRIRIRIYARCGQVVRFALYRGARRVRAFTRHVPPRTVSVTLRGRFARGGYAIRVAGGARGRRLGDGQSFVVRR
jgi:hypothetical protein